MYIVTDVNGWSCFYQALGLIFVKVFSRDGVLYPGAYGYYDLEVR